MPDLNDYSRLCHDASIKAGWWRMPTPETPAVKIALIHSEISEALEGIRKGARDEHIPSRSSIEVELADALIRIFDLAGYMDLDLEGALKDKMEYNKQRQDHKPEARSAEGGKKF